MDNLTDNDLVIMVEMAHRTCKLNVLRKARDEQANRKEFEEEAKEIEEEEDKVQEKYYENAGIYRINGKLYKKHYTAEEGSLPCHRCCFFYKTNKSRDS